MVEKNLTKQYGAFFLANPSTLPQKYTWAITGIEMAELATFYFDLFLHDALVASTIIHPEGIDESAIEYISTIALNYRNPHLEEYLHQNMLSL